MADNVIRVSEVQLYLESQILSLQIDWMDYNAAGNAELRRQQEVVLDGIYAFIEHFMGIPAPAPGQGYQPPGDVWQQTLKTRQIQDIDRQISDLVSRREHITGEAFSLPVDGHAMLEGVTSLTAEPDEG